jgi:hypothetical protein
VSRPSTDGSALTGGGRSVDLIRTMRRVLLDVSDLDHNALDVAPNVGDRTVILDTEYEVIDRREYDSSRDLENSRCVELLLAPFR